MMRVLIALLFAGWFTGTGAGAEEVVLGLSHDEVAITATFDGSDLFIFGAVRREEAIAEGSPLQVVIAVAGPSEPVIVRRKERRFGVWVNTSAVKVDAAPSSYAIATTGPLDEVLSGVEDLRNQISLDRAIRVVGIADATLDAGDFTDALTRIKAGDDLYQLLEGAVDLAEDTLFHVVLSLPANLIEGNYATRIFLTRDGKVIDAYETVIPVKKVGLERWLYTLSQENPFFYGVLSLAVAIAAGWGASTAFRALQRN